MASKEWRLNIEMDLAMAADSAGTKHSRHALVWRGLLTAAEASPGTPGAQLANHLLDLMADELAEVGQLGACKLPGELAALALFIAVDWPPRARRGV